jgi:hypothetical protein
LTLYGDFLSDAHRRTHKWFQYFPAYELHLERFRNRHITLFEVGVGEGGSLQQWRKYLGPYALIVGMDIHGRCKQLEEPQIHIRIGSQDDLGFLGSVVNEFGAPDIVIDDGSHLQRHINATFNYLYPLVAKNGLYMVEDLHAAYWPDHGGGLGHRDSFIELAKSYIDRMHADYIGDETLRTAEGKKTASIHFYDSLVVFEVGEQRLMGHATTGDPKLFDRLWQPPISEAERIKSLEETIAALHTSTSWRLTAPLRALSGLFKRRPSRHG